MGTFNCKIWIKEGVGDQSGNDRIETQGKNHYETWDSQILGKNKKIFT
jgi:hypothetical protein